MAKGTVSGNYLMYQGKPLIRQDNAYVWGDMKNDRAALLLLVLSNKEVNGKQVPDNILVQVVSTDDTQKVLKQGQKNGLYAALDIGTVWLKKEQILPAADKGLHHGGDAVVTGAGEVGVVGGRHGGAGDLHAGEGDALAALQPSATDAAAHGGDAVVGVHR